MKKSREKHIDAIKQCLVDHNYKEDNYGNFKDPTGLIRYHFSKIVLRKERKCESTKQWVRVTSGFYKDITIGEDNKLRGLK